MAHSWRVTSPAADGAGAGDCQDSIASGGNTHLKEIPISPLLCLFKSLASVVLLKHCKETTILVVSIAVQEPHEMPFSTKIGFYLFVT